MLMLQKKTQFHQKKECCAGALEGSFLKSLVRLTGAKTVLEVGMFTGTSSLAMAEALPSDGKVLAMASDRCSLLHKSSFLAMVAVFFTNQASYCISIAMCAERWAGTIVPAHCNTTLLSQSLRVRVRTAHGMVISLMACTAVTLVECRCTALR